MTEKKTVKHRWVKTLVRVEHDKQGRPMNVYKISKQPIVEGDKVCVKELR